MDLIDLHIHSTYSDGVLSPEAIVGLAQKKGLKAIAITDHDTVAGVTEAEKYGSRQGLEVISGIEISSWHGETPLHILGYYFQQEEASLSERLRKLQNARHTRNIRIIENLNRLGFAAELDDLIKYSKYGQTGRPHIAQMMVDKGYVKTVDEAFSRYLRRGGKAYADRFKYYSDEAIDMITRAGGIAVLAHPGCIDPSLKEIPVLLGDLANLGLGGVEVYYPTHSIKAVKALKEMAEDIGLLITGGSDFHGNTRSKSPFGGVKDSRVPAQLLEKMKAGRKEK